MEPLTNISVIRELMRKAGFTFSKSLGQNFIINPSVCPKIAQLGGAGPDTGVLEIGPGFGVLTRELAANARKVVAIEIDERLPPILSETLAGFSNVCVICADVLKLDLARLLEEEFSGMEVVVCANLPYYITSPIVMSLLEQRLPVRAITVMVQREAAQRICAAPGTRQAGAISAAVAYYSEPKMLFTVSPGSFLPAPEVESAVIRLDIRPKPAVEVRDERLFFGVVRGAFGQRRKTAINALNAALEVPKAELQQVFARCGLSGTVRAEQLTLADFAAVANELAAVREPGGN